MKNYKEFILIGIGLIVLALVLNSFRKKSTSEVPKPPELPLPAPANITEEQARMIAESCFNTMKALFKDESKMLDQLVQYGAGDLTLIWNSFNEYYSTVPVLKLGLQPFGSFGSALIRECNTKEIEKARNIFSKAGIYF